MSRNVLFGVAVAALLSVPAYAGSVVGSRHDLSTAGTPEVCEFCHTPHNANTNLQAPLWNRAETTQTFALYGSPTMNMPGAQPGMASRLCLSCHDGVNASTVVHGNTVSTKHDLVKPPNHPAPDMTSEPNCERCHSDMYSGRRRTLVLGTDLSNDHPIAISYPTQAQDADFNAPPDPLRGWGGLSPNNVKLYGGSVECSSCHDAHDPGTGAGAGAGLGSTAQFLRMANTSALCLTCHKK
jgi:hypothetical protein